MKKGRNPFTAWAVGALVAAAVAFAVALVFATEGDYGWYVLCESVGVVASIFLGMMMEKRSSYAVRLEQERELREFLEFIRAVSKGVNVVADKEPFDEFLKRESGGDGKSEEQRAE